MIALLTLIEREMVRFYRQPSRVIGALLTPLLFWVMIGGGVGRSFNAGSGGGGHSGTGNFMQYFYVGTVVLIVFFTAIFSTISVIEDRREGFLQGVLVAPVSRLTVAGGKILGGALLAVAQGALFLLLAGLAGYSLNPVSLPWILLILSLLAIGLTGLGFIIAWQMDSTQGFHAIMNVFLIPLWILSGAAFPAAGAAPWLRTVMMLNPVTYGVAGLRHAFLFGCRCTTPPGLPSFELCLAVLAGFALAMVTLSALVVQRRTSAHG